LLEALAAGRPAIVSDTAAHRRYVTNQQHGLTFPRGDVEALAVCIERIFSQPTLATALGNAARQRMTQDFSLDSYVDAHLELFEPLIQRAATRVD
jgi:glycosyltransferase involved in cell wall biosynthesis